MKDKEYILCAAIWYKELPLIKTDLPYSRPKNIENGIVFCGHRHVQCLYAKCALTGLKDSQSGENEQGFLTSQNRFVSREVASLLAFEAGQIKEKKNRLFSEDLY